MRAIGNINVQPIRQTSGWLKFAHHIEMHLYNVTMSMPFDIEFNVDQMFLWKKMRESCWTWELDSSETELHGQTVRMV